MITMTTPASESTPAVFQFRSAQVRTIDRKGQIWFVANDVARALGYRDADKMVRWLDNDEMGTHIVGTLGGDQTVTIISESGLYHAMLKSRKPEAKPFRRWVTEDVLPQIRRTGSYASPIHQSATRILLTVEADGRYRAEPVSEQAMILTAQQIAEAMERQFTGSAGKAISSLTEEERIAQRRAKDRQRQRRWREKQRTGAVRATDKREVH